MLGRKMIALMLGLVLSGSCIFLATLVIGNKEYLHASSYPRLITLIIIHLLIAGYVGICIRVQLLEEAVRWGFYFSANITAFITITQLYVFRSKKQYSKMEVVNFSEPPQLIYINVYFLLYMFSLILSFVLGIIILTFCCMEWVRQKRFELSLSRNMRQIGFSSSLKEQDCPICLSSFSETDIIYEITCHHKFHQSCLNDWIKLNYTCPNCRFSLLTDEQEGEQEQGQGV